LDFFKEPYIKLNSQFNECVEPKFMFLKKKTKIEINCHFRFKLIKIRLEVSLIFYIETIFLKNYIQNWFLIPFMCRIGIEIEIVLSFFLKQKLKVLHKNKKLTNIRLDIKMYHKLCIHILLIKYMWMNILCLYWNILLQICCVYSWLKCTISYKKKT